uniref:septation protein SepH n=1 Tax=Tessaracoccus timonensis TaxID=2161816 RepID=UPI000D5540B2|nr:septation protein SepH [Tessaracoccus timonensis]
MNSALSPREIQARIRGGESVGDVARDAGVDVSDIEGFAGPVLAEREFMVANALKSTIRRRGEQSHRRLGELVSERLQQRGLDADAIVWDAWRQEDLRWRVVGILGDDAGTRTAEFLFDHKRRFSVADNADARWIIGEQLPDAGGQDENTVDFNDELALLRATREEAQQAPASPGDDVPVADAMHDGHEDTSSLDELYDMLSGISEDSVRIYTGLSELDAIEEQSEAAAEEELRAENETSVEDAPPVEEEGVASSEAPSNEEPADPQPKVSEPVQDSLVDDPEGEAPKPKEKKPRKRRGRAHVPSWDEIMFGGPRI